MTTRWVLIGMLLGGLTSVAAADVATDANSDTTKKEAPLEQQLFDDLGADLLDDLKSAGGAKPKTAKTDKLPAQAGEGDSLDEKLLEDLGDLNPGGEDFGAESEQDPFLTIGREMRKAGELIGERKSADETQQLQAKIVGQLDALIKQIQQRKKQQQQSSSRQKIAGSTRQTPKLSGKTPAGSPGKTAKQPPRDSENRLNKAKPRKVDMAAMKKLMEEFWGDLPERARPEMLQSSTEEFLPKYELKIERYFRRLAEQRRDE